MNEQITDLEFDSYIKLLSIEQKESILHLIKSFIDQSNRLSLEQYNNELDAAEDRISKGQFISHEEIEKESMEW